MIILRGMARKPRSFSGGVVYHVMNRASARARIFHKDADYALFETVLAQAVGRFDLRLLTYIVMPNHFHLVLWPRKGEGEKISGFMKWLQQTHTQRWHAHLRNAGEGRLYQGRFKAFPVQGGWGDFQYVRKVCRYVERNAVRANLVKSAEEWKHGALWRRLYGRAEEREWLAAWPEGAYPGDAKWVGMVNQVLRGAEEKALGESFRRGSPFGAAAWRAAAAARMGLEHTMRPRGRPRKGSGKDV